MNIKQFYIHTFNLVIYITLFYVVVALFLDYVSIS